MRYLIERTNGAVECVEADNFNVREIGGAQSVFDGKQGGYAIYIFQNDPVERYGSGLTVASFTDVRTVRIVAVEPKAVTDEPSSDLANEPTGELVN
jgi:hypothetical protein